MVDVRTFLVLLSPLKEAIAKVAGLSFFGVSDTNRGCLQSLASQEDGGSRKGDLPTHGAKARVAFSITRL